MNIKKELNIGRAIFIQQLNKHFKNDCPGLELRWTDKRKNFVSVFYKNKEVLINTDVFSYKMCYFRDSFDFCFHNCFHNKTQKKVSYYITTHYHSLLNKTDIELDCFQHQSYTIDIKSTLTFSIIATTFINFMLNNIEGFRQEKEKEELEALLTQKVEVRKTVKRL